jgi:ActR/RegA family two-component response regulator
MSEQNMEPTVTESELQKSIESLMALLDTEAPVVESLDKSMAHLGTLGGLADRAGAPPLDPSLEIGGAEMEQLGEEQGEDLDAVARHVATQGMGFDVVKKSLEKSAKGDDDEEQDDEQDDDEHDDKEEEMDEEFAKSLAAAFAEQDQVVEAAASSEFAKSLVLGTIEGLSIAHDEFAKSLAEMEDRQDAKVAVLAKGLAAIAKAVDEIRAEVVKVSNAPARPMAKSVRVLEKSFGGQEASVDPMLLKSKVTAALERRVADGKLDAFQLVRYETSGVLDPVLAKDIQSELGL